MTFYWCIFLQFFQWIRNQREILRLYIFFDKNSCPLDLLSEGRAAPAVCWGGGGGVATPPSPVWTWGGENLLYLSPPKGTVQ